MCLQRGLQIPWLPADWQAPSPIAHISTPNLTTIGCMLAAFDILSHWPPRAHRGIPKFTHDGGPSPHSLQPADKYQEYRSRRCHCYSNVTPWPASSEHCLGRGPGQAWSAAWLQRRSRVHGSPKSHWVLNLVYNVAPPACAAALVRW